MRNVLSADLQAEAAALSDLSDDSIDTVDIPEASPEAWRYARHPELYGPIKRPVTLRLDADVIAWFKEHAPGGGYQTEINRVLRRYVSQAEA